ncbi:MAG: glucuronosyltransferase [Caulobacteraceae bacterium]|nr:glucuronosyltransferase [Caulobacteraceae bacterium]
MLVIASGGGHWIQMRRLRPAFDDLDVAYVTIHPDYALDVPGRRFYSIPDATRFSLGNLAVMIPRLARILLRERPDVVITTGSFPGLICLALARVLTRARTMWIDSIANCERMSSSGARARWFAHVWLTQWPELATPNGPGHWGAVL